MSKTKEYVVVQSGVTVKVGGDVLEVGAKVQLTKAQARARINKVVLKSEYAVAPTAAANAGEIEKLQSELEKLRTESAAQKIQIKDLLGVKK